MTYIVKEGDSLSKIARDQLGNLEMWPLLASINNLSAPYTIYPGQRIDLDMSGRGIVGPKSESTSKMIIAEQQDSLAAGWLRQDRILIGVVAMIVILVLVWIYQTVKGS